MTGNREDSPDVIPTYFEVKVAKSSSDYPKVSVVGEFYVFRRSPRDEIESINKQAIERRLAEAIADHVELEQDGDAS